METAILHARRLRAARCAAILASALLTFPQVFLRQAQGEPPAKPNPGRDLAAANKLAERYDGGVTAPKLGLADRLGISTILLDRRAARWSEPVTVAYFPSEAQVKLGDRGFVRLCKLLRGLPGPKALVLEETAVSDRGLAAVGRLTDLRRLQLRGTPIGDNGLKHVRGLKQLQILDLSRTKVTDAGLKHLKGLGRLKELSLVGVLVSDAGLAVLAKLSGLECLDLTDTPVGNKGLAHLKGLKELRSLRLAGTHIQDGALKALVGLKELRNLDLHGTIVGNAGLASLRGLSRLSYLRLSQTNVGDAGLAHLAGLRNLEVLSLEKTRVTEAGVKHLADLPSLEALSGNDRPAINLARNRIAFAEGNALGALGRGGKIKLVADGSTKLFLLARLHDTETGKHVGSKLYHKRLAPWAREQITCWAFSPDGKLVATGSGYRDRSGPDKTSVGQVRVWEVPGGDLMATYPEALGYVSAVAFSKDGKKVLVQAESHEIDGR
jgi:hypothetical protein